MGPPVTCVLSSPNASGAAHGLLPEALHKPGGGSLARAGGLPELAYGEGQGHELHREEVSNDKSEQSHYSFWTSRPSRVIARTPGNESWQAAGTGHVDRRDVAARQRPHDPNVDAARGGRGGNRPRPPPKAILHPQVPARPRPAQQRMRAEEARRRRPVAQPRADCVPPHRPPAWRRDGLSRAEHPRQRSDHLHHAQPGVSRPRARCDGRKCAGWESWAWGVAGAAALVERGRRGHVACPGREAAPVAGVREGLLHLPRLVAALGAAALNEASTARSR